MKHVSTFWRNLIVSTIAIVFYSPILTNAQENPNRCRDAFEGGRYNIIKLKSESNLSKSLQIIFNKDYSYWKNYNKQTDHNTDSDVASGYFFLTFSSSNSDSENEQIFNTLKTNFIKNSTYNSSEKTESFFKILDTTTTKALLNCLVNENQAKKDFEPGFYNIDSVYFMITLSKFPFPGAGNSNIVSINPGNSVFVSGDLQPGTKIDQYQTRSGKFQRNSPYASVNVVINGDNFSSTITRPSTIRPNNGMPIGTIVASVLDYKTFSKLNGDLEIFNIEKSKWAPCDGRNVGKSAFGSVRGNVPDLRGVFLRGLNKFMDPEDGASELKENHKDPEPNRNAGSFQSDTLKNHKHAIRFSVSDNPSRYNDDGKAAAQMASTTNDINNKTGQTDKGGEETRPKNIAVYYYIRIN
jgi:hypothetical protein